MEELLPLQMIQISCPTLASLVHSLSSSPGDLDGLLFGHVSLFTPSTFSDDNPTTTALIATITSFFSSTSTSSFYSSTGHLHLPSLHHLLSSHHHNNLSLLGWFSGRRQTPLRPSMRESSVTSSLSSTTQLHNSPKPYSFSPSIFLLLTTPFQAQLIHSHDYKAFQFRSSTQSFEAKTLDVVNIGPAFRSHYGDFSPNSPFPVLGCELRGLNSMVEYGKGEFESLEGMSRVSDDQRDLDLCVEEFDVGRLNRLMGPEAMSYSGELEDLYDKMLAKLDGLARLVEKSSARVLEQENHNMKLRYRVAGLE